MSDCFPGSRAAVRVAVAQEDKCCNNKCPPLLFSLSFIAEQTAHGLEYSLGLSHRARDTGPVQGPGRLSRAQVYALGLLNQQFI